MTTYEVLVSDGLLSEFTNDNPALPAGFKVLEVLPKPPDAREFTQVRVSDENAPAWTEGKLVDVAFKAEYNDDGSVARTTVASYALLVGTIEDAVTESKANPGVTVTVRS